MSELYVIRTKEFQRNFDREMYVRTKEDIIIMADGYRTLDYEYEFYIQDTEAKYPKIASFSKGDVLMITRKSNLATG